MKKRWKLFTLMALFAFGVTLISWPHSAQADLGTLTASVSSATVGQTVTVTGSMSNLSGASVTLVSSSGNWVSGTVSTGETVAGVGTPVLAFTSSGSTVSSTLIGTYTCAAQWHGDLHVVAEPCAGHRLVVPDDYADLYHGCVDGDHRDAACRRRQHGRDDHWWLHRRRRAAQLGRSRPVRGLPAAGQRDGTSRHVGVLCRRRHAHRHVHLHGRRHRHLHAEQRVGHALLWQHQQHPVAVLPRCWLPVRHGLPVRSTTHVPATPTAAPLRHHAATRTPQCRSGRPGSATPTAACTASATTWRRLWLPRPR